MRRRKGKYYSICADIDNFAKHGVGLKLYFAFMKQMMIVFTIMFIISLPAVYSNYSGKGISDGQTYSFGMYYTLAN